MAGGPIATAARIHGSLMRRLRAAPEAAVRSRLRRRIAAAPLPSFDAPRVFYGVERMPEHHESASGGFVKFQRLATAFPNHPSAFNVFYTGSSGLLPDLSRLLALARERRARVVWNQDGVLYPGLGWDMRPNARMAEALHAADHVFFQSEFCKLAADRFLGARGDPWEVLPNAVDTSVFTPAEREVDGLVLLLGGSQYQWYRVDAALQATAIVVREREDVRLVIAGALSWRSNRAAARRETVARARELGIDAYVELAGPYGQDEAPDLYRRAHVLLHTKYNDPCPSTVVEAMACGLPVVYSASGGVPELVGRDGGIGVPAPLDFERDHPPEPHALAAAVLEAAERRAILGAAARARAVERFDLAPWVERHRQVFEGLLA